MNGFKSENRALAVASLAENVHVRLHTISISLQPGGQNLLTSFRLGCCDIEWFENDARYNTVHIHEAKLFLDGERVRDFGGSL